MGLLDKNQGMRYMGPGGHIMAYPLRKNTLYNVVLVHETNDVKRKTTSWTATGKMEEVSEHYRGWSPMVQDLISHARGSEVLETPMNDMSPLPTWVKGRIALTGDACRKCIPVLFNYPFCIRILPSSAPKNSQTPSDAHLSTYDKANT